MTIDFFFNKLIPKKFVVFSIATVGLFLNLVTGEQWTIVAGIYLGTNVLKALIPFVKKD